MLPRPLVHDLAFRQEEDVVEEIERLGSRLEERHEDRGVREASDLLQALHYLECGRAVEPGRYLVHEQRLGGPHNHLSCIVS